MSEFHLIRKQGRKGMWREMKGKESMEKNREGPQSLLVKDLLQNHSEP